MPTLLIVGGGLFGSQAAAYARSKGLEVRVFDSGQTGQASPASGGLFKERWVHQPLRGHFRVALPVLERLYGIQTVRLFTAEGKIDSVLFVPPSLILESQPVREHVTAVGDGWVEAGGVRYDGFVYVAAGSWCHQLLPDLQVYTKGGAAFLYPGEREGLTRKQDPIRHAIAFVRDRGTTYFTDGTAELSYTPEQDRAALDWAAELGFPSAPQARLWGLRPYVQGGPVFERLGARLWVATGGRKLGTILGAAFARRLIEDELP